MNRFRHCPKRHSDVTLKDGEAGDKPGKRARTILNPDQREKFQNTFKVTPKPCKQVTNYWVFKMHN